MFDENVSINLTEGIESITTLPIQNCPDLGNGNEDDENIEDVEEVDPEKVVTDVEITT